MSLQTTYVIHHLVSLGPHNLVPLLHQLRTFVPGTMSEVSRLVGLKKRQFVPPVFIVGNSETLGKAVKQSNFRNFENDHIFAKVFRLFQRNGPISVRVMSISAP